MSEKEVTFEQRKRHYAKGVARAVIQEIDHCKQANDDAGTDLSDDVIVMVAMRNVLGRLRDEAEARINAEAQINDILG